MTEFQDLADDPRPNAPREPLLTTGLVIAVVTALLDAVVSLGLPLTDTQEAKVLVLVTLLAPAMVVLVGRGKVFSPATVARLVARARAGR